MNTQMLLFSEILGFFPRNLFKALGLSLSALVVFSVGSGSAHGVASQVDTAGSVGWFPAKGTGSPPRRAASPQDVIRYQGSGGTEPPPVVGGELGEPVHPLGEQSTAVLLVNFSDTAGDTPYGIAEAEDAVFGTVNDFLLEASYGQTWLTGDVHGWFTLPIASTCNTVEIGNAADTAAMAAGIDLSGYNRFVYVFKGSATCSWNGSADLWVYPSRAWIRGNIVPQIIAHELGHNLGLEHSYQLECGDQVIDELSTDCRYARDDKFDTMGSANYPGHFNSFQKDRLGWMREGEVQVVTESGSYLLSPIESATTAHPKALKILRFMEPDGAGATWYYLEYRQPLGFDAPIAGNANVENGILVRTGEDSDANSSLLLDMTPASSVLVSQDRSDPALVVGASYTDPDTGMTLTTEWTDGSVASVLVSFGTGGGDTCLVGAPELNLSTELTEPVTPGTTVTYDLMVSNTDSVGCPVGEFNLAAQLPADWVISFDNTTLNLIPGEQATVGLELTAAISAQPGSYTIPLSATHTAGPDSQITTEVSVNYTDGTDNTAPVAVNDGVSISQIAPVTIFVLANDWDPDGDVLILESTSQGNKGAVSMNADGSLTYTPERRFKTNDSFSYTVSDGVSGASATVSVTLQADSDSSGGKGGGKGGGKPRR